MQNQISVFNFRTTEVRTVVRDGEAWFVASDIAKALNYRDAEKMARMLDDDERGTHIVGTVSTNQHGTASEQSNTVIVINESGMYHAVLKSRKPEAKPFRKWVTSEVLPTIRKTGRYEAAPYSVNPGDTLTKTQADTLRDLLTSTVKKLPQEKQASAMIRGWSKLKAHFGTGYRQIPQGEFVEALSIVARHCVTVHALEGELLEAEPKHTSLNETVADLVRQLESPNGAPSAVFMPLVNAVLKKQGFDLSNSPQMKPPAFARSLPSGTPDAKRNLAAVQKVLRNLRSWGIEELPRHVRPDFCDAIAEIDSLLVTGWTEVDEALTRIELGTSFLKRWNQGGGCGIGRIQFIA